MGESSFFVGCLRCRFAGARAEVPCVGWTWFGSVCDGGRDAGGDSSSSLILSRVLESKS